MTKPRVYSYLRFSDPRQSAGSSADRQTEYARRWAAERGLVLDEALTMRDEGLSAYHQRHVTQGALGVFLAAISDGRIAAGSVLIVEGLDRLSRAEPILAQAQLSQIISAGVTVVTASDGREYNRETLRAQPMDLVYSLLVMIRAYEESDTKSRRVKAAIRRQCEQWIAGTYRGVIRNGKDPAWVRWNGAAFELIPERAEATRLAIARYRMGDGAVRTFKHLGTAGLTLTPAGGTAANLYKMMRVPALRGVKRIEVGGESYELEGYYPPLLSDQEWAELQHLLSDRRRRRGRGEIVGFITGISMTYCGYCGEAMVAQNIMHRVRADGSLADGHRRLICCGYSAGNQCPVPGSISIVPVERALLAWCADQMNLASLMEGDGQVEAIRGRLADLRSQAAKTEAQIERITEALLSDDAPPAAFARKARELEADLESQKTEILDAEGQMARLARTSTESSADVWMRLRDAALEMDSEARLQVRKLVLDTFSKIEIYHRGTPPQQGKKPPIQVQLTSKTGVRRILMIDRRTGDYTAGWNAQAVARPLYPTGPAE